MKTQIIDSRGSTLAPRNIARKPYDLTYIPLGSGGWGGAERSLLDLAGRAALRGKRVLILAEHALKASPFEEEAHKRNVELRWVEWAPEHSLIRNLLAVQSVLRNLDTSIIHFNISWRRGMTVIPLLARLLTRSKLIGSMRAMPDPNGLAPRKRYLGGVLPGLGLWTIPDRFRGRVWARTMHITVSVNRDDYPQRLIQEYGFSTEKLRVIYNGVEIPEQLPSESESAAIRSQYGFAAADFVVCYFGRISSEKGVHHLLEAMTGLPAHVRLFVVGEGPEETALRELARSLGITDRVHFAGFLSKPETVVAACNLVAVPSTWYEAFGRTVVEALSYQVPVVASRVGGMAELFLDGEQGIYVPPANSEALRKAILSLADNPALARQMGIKGRDWVLSRYSLDRVANDYLALYDELTSKQSAAQ